MHVRRYFALLMGCWLSMGYIVGGPRALFAQGAAQVSTTTATPGEIALALRNRQGADRLNYEAQLRAAQLAFEAGDYQSVELNLRRLSVQTFLNSQAIELLYRTQLARGEDSLAMRTLNEGLGTYPHAVRLQRLAGEAALAEGTIARPTDIMQRFSQLGVRSELQALLAFKRGDAPTGLLEAERAAYLYDAGNTLGPATRQAIMAAYSRLLEPSDSDTEVLEAMTAIPANKAAAYARCLAEAAERLEGSGLDTLGTLRYLAKLRAVALRTYATRGFLASFPDPLLTDLYVLDRAGHLETATARQLSWIAPAEWLRFEQRFPRDVLRAQTYIAEEWRGEADAYLNLGR